MEMYANIVVSLINRLYFLADQSWYADHTASCGSLFQLHQWWDSLNYFGPLCEYFPGAKKTPLVKSGLLSSAQQA